VRANLALIALSLFPLACAHGDGGKSGSGSGDAPPVIDTPIKHLVRLADMPPELANSSTPAVFEQMLCNRLFEFNQKQVMCADDLKVFIQHKREEAMLGGQEVNMEQILGTLDVPRQVAVTAVKAGDRIMLTVLVQDAKGTPLGRFEKTLKPDGSDVLERATETAIAILKVKQ
jgi:hypothetical protein